MSAPETGFTREEVRLALRNPGMPLEGAAPRRPRRSGCTTCSCTSTSRTSTRTTTRSPSTGGSRAPLALGLDDLRARPAVTQPVMMECAGSGRARLTPRPQSAPWHDEAIGCAEWTGTPLRAILEAAGLLDDAVEIVFTGHDRGIDQGVEHDYQRSLTVEEALRDDVLLAYAMNGVPLPAAHGFPLRLIVPGWYGMASVKWLRSITAVAEPFEGVQQTLLYTFRRSADEPGERVTRQRPRVGDGAARDPGVPVARSGTCAPAARPSAAARGPASARSAASSSAPTAGRRGADARLEPAASPHGWAAWSYDWDAAPGEHELCVRATDAAGNSQPQHPDDGWNMSGYAVNAVQRVPVRVAA